MGRLERARNEILQQMGVEKKRRAKRGGEPTEQISSPMPFRGSQEGWGDLGTATGIGATSDNTMQVTWGGNENFSNTYNASSIANT